MNGVGMFEFRNYRGYIILYVPVSTLKLFHVFLFQMNFLYCLWAFSLLLYSLSFITYRTGYLHMQYDTNRDMQWLSGGLCICSALCIWKYTVIIVCFNLLESLLYLIFRTSHTFECLIFYMRTPLRKYLRALIRIDGYRPYNLEWLLYVEVTCDL